MNSILANYLVSSSSGETELDKLLNTDPNRNEYYEDLYICDTRFIKSDTELEGDSASEAFRANRNYTKASYKFVGTGLGQGLACNPRPQFTRYCDIPARNLVDVYDEPKVEVLQHNLGMGRYYAEAIDDNATLLYLQFGVPKFNSLLNYLTNAVDFQEAVLASSGGKSWLYTIGKAYGIYTVFVCFPLAASLIVAAKFLYNLFVTQTSFDYYYMKPAMHSYWGSVNTIVMQMVSELKMVPNVLEKETTYAKPTDRAQQEQLSTDGTPPKETPKRIYPYTTDGDIIEYDKNGDPIKYDLEALEKKRQALGEAEMSPLKYLSEVYKDVVTKRGYIDVFALALRPQIRYRLYLEARKLAISQNKISAADAYGAGSTEKSWSWTEIGKTASEYREYRAWLDKYKKTKDDINKHVDFHNFQKEYVRHVDNPDNKQPEKPNLSKEQGTTDATAEVTDDEKKAREQASREEFVASAEENARDNENNGFLDWLGRLTATDPFDKFMKELSKTAVDENTIMNNWRSMMMDGGGYAIFQVQAPRSQTDSFINSVEDIPVGSAVKQIATASRQFKFNTAGGNVGFGIDLGAIVGGITNLVAGAIDGVTGGIGGSIATLLGNAFVDLPKMWSDSDVSISSTSYTLELRSPYGNQFSQLQNLYIPLAMLMAGALPQRTGHASYGSPFLCSAFCQGVQNTKLGMITSLSIERGVGNVPYNNQRRPMGFNVNFTVTDFSTLVTTPISTSVFDVFKIMSMDDSAFGRYIGTMMGRSFNVNKYTMAKVGAKWDRFKHVFTTGFGKSNLMFTAMELYDNTISPLVELTTIPTIVRIIQPYGADRT